MNGECLIIISDAFVLFCLLFTGIRHLAHVLTVPPTKACLLCATPAGCDLYIYSSMPVGTYRMQSLGFPKLRQTVDNSFVLGPILLELFPFNSGMTLRSTVV